MRKYFSLIGAVIAAINLVYSFFGDFVDASIFGIEMNIWVYRAIWAFLALWLFFSFYMQNKQMK